MVRLILTLAISQGWPLRQLDINNAFLQEVLPHPNGLFLSLKKYVSNILCKANMDRAKSVATPLATHPPLTKAGKLLPDPTKYRALVGSLQYISLTRPDLTFSVNKLAQYMQRSTEEHWLAMKRLMRYLSGTLNMGLSIHKNLLS
ncbi:hypothetical protein AgCh_006345 [Apium graveolens]